MARMRHKISNRTLLVWLTLAGFIILLGPQKITGKFQGAFTRIFRFPLRIGRAVTLSAKIADLPKYELQIQQTEYQNHIANLTAQIDEKNRQIEELAGLRQRYYGLEGAALVLADVISATIEGPRNELIINRGRNDGLERGQFVLGHNSIIGVISEVWQRTAAVRLITDTDSKLPVIIKGMDKVLWMFGCGDGWAKIFWVKTKIQTGTEVLIQKHPGRLDCVMICGRVKSCNRNEQNALLWDITVRPGCDITTLQSVAVIIMNPQN